MANKFKQGGAKDISLAEQYKKDTAVLQKYENSIRLSK
jgi:hypothetical protein